MELATAIPAIPATHNPESTGTVATIATVAVAKPQREQAAAPITNDQEAAILAWLAHIGETDPAIIAEVLASCRRDGEALAYFLGRAGESLPCDAKKSGGRPVDTPCE